MPLDPRQQLCLVDAQATRLGAVTIRRIEGDRVYATFAATDDFSAVRQTFRDFEEAVNDQMFSEVDRLSQDIDALALRLASDDGSDFVALDDVQIMNDTDLSCRVPNLGLTQAKPAAAHAG